MTQARVFGRALFSIYVWTAAFAWMLLGATLTLVLLALRLPYQRVHVWLTAPMFSRVLTLATIRLRVSYDPRFDPEQRCVFVQNHINLLDGHLAARVIPHAFSGLMNAWQFKIPVYGWLMSMSKGIPVRRDKRHKVIEEISAAAAERKRIGMSILAFPEGHRTMDGHVRPFKPGVFLMARNAEMPIVPICVRGLYNVNNKRMGWIFAPRQLVEVYVGPQFETAGLSTEACSELAVAVQRRMSHFVEHGRWPQDHEIEHAA